MSVVNLVVRLVDEFSSKVPAIVNGIDKIDGRGRGGGGRPVAPASPVPASPSPGGGGGGGSSQPPRLPGGSGAPGAPEGKGGGRRAVGIAAGAGGLAIAAAKLQKSMQGVRNAVLRTAAFDDMLQGIAQTGDMTAEQLASLRSTILNLAPSLGRLPQQIANVANELVAAGIAPDRAEKMLAPIGRVAVATRSEIGDINKAAMSMAQNLEIAADDIEGTFDKIWTAAKRGNFELKDMAQFFPTIAAAASSRGMTGIAAAVELAAAAQIVRETAGKDVGQAATNLKNLLFKMTAPQTVKKFEKYGVDLKAAMEKGVSEGRSPLETIILETRKLLDANKGLTVGNLFQDTTAQLALAKLIEKYDQFVAIREEASKATGTIATDFAEMTSTLQASVDRLAASIDRREKVLGRVAAPFEKLRSGFLARLNNWLADLADRFPRLAGGIGVVGLALGDLASVVSNVWPSLLGLASSFALIKFSGLGRVIGGLGRLIARGLGAAFFWLVRFPAAILSGVMQGFVEGLAPLAARLAPLFARLGPAILAGLAALGPLLLRGIGMLARLFMGPVGWALIGAQLAWSFRSEIGSALSGIASWFQERFQALFGGISLADIGAKLMQSLLDGLKRAAASVVGWASSFASRLKGLFSFGGSASPPAAIPQSYRPSGLTPAPGRQANLTFNNTFTVNGGADPEGAARRILAALDRQRQAGLYDGALA